MILLCATALEANFGFDAGRTPQVVLEEFLDPFGIGPEEGAWLRLRPVARRLPDEWRPGDVEALRAFRDPQYIAEVEGLVELRERGFKLAAGMLHLGGADLWESGVREGPNARRRLPLDLREAYWRAFAAGFLYAGLFDVWEIENEPDIDFVAENPHAYASFHKAFYLGLRAGEEAAIETGLPALPSVDSGSSRSMILMAPLAMPPGPYFERLSRNGFWAYTDGFNYHYYGYPEDFEGVYRQFEDAVAELSGDMRADPPALRRPRLNRRFFESCSIPSVRQFPVFLTEYGYGYLTPEASGTTEGRLRQKNWFESVLPQIAELGIEGPMAFYLPPYASPSGIEFGLFARREESPWFDEWRSGDSGHDRGISVASSLVMTPALEAMLGYARENPHEARHWKMPTARPSGVVIDFIAGQDVIQEKPYLGYFLSRISDVGVSGRGDLVLYNLSPVSTSGRVVVTVGGRPAIDEFFLVLPSMGRIQIALDLHVPGKVLAPHALEARFMPSDRASPVAMMCTKIWHSLEGMRSKPVYTFDFPMEAAANNREILERREVATGEPVLGENGGWHVSSGVVVCQTPTGWSFEIEALPGEPLRPAMAELPLPDDFRFLPGEFFEFYYRAAESDFVFEPYFRTSNGNLYSVWPRLLAGGEWRHYLQAHENFTMAFHGRANLPWRFEENEPVALVFFFRPDTLPVTLETAFPQISRIVKSIDRVVEPDVNE